MESITALVTLENTGKLIALIVSVFTAFKAFKEVSSKKTEKLRADYDFADKFLAEDKWKELHDYLLERGYWALSGTQLKADEIRYFLQAKDPLSKFQDYKKSLRYLHCTKGSDDKLKVEYNTEFNEKKRNSVRRWNLSGYVVTAFLSLLPIMYLSNFLQQGFSGVATVLVWSSAFGCLAYLCLSEYGNLMAAKRVMETAHIDHRMEQQETTEINSSVQGAS
jgi:hypothetical protein